MQCAIFSKCKWNTNFFVSFQLDRKEHHKKRVTDIVQKYGAWQAMNYQNINIKACFDYCWLNISSVYSVEPRVQ